MSVTRLYNFKTTSKSILKVQSTVVQNVVEGIYEILPQCLSVVLYGCETWSPTLREEHTRTCMLMVFENRVLQRIFGPKGNEVTRGSFTTYTLLDV
jgi:hypothetical protein